MRGSSSYINIEKNLKHLAKKYKSVKYSLGLTILFLMMGLNAFSEEILEKESLHNSVKTLQEKIQTIKKENQNQVKGLKLELVQLMEQGDQVVKSPWSSWQIGTNYMYSKWNGTYKGYGNKKLTEAFVRDNSNSLDKYLEKLEDGKSFTYGATDLVMVSEPEAEIEVSAGVNPKIINKKEVSYTPKAPDGILPPFQPKLISPPEKPEELEVTEPATFNPPEIKFKGKGFYQYGHIGMPRLSGANVVIQNYDSYDTVSMTDGKTKGIFNIEVGKLEGGARVKWWGSNLDGTKNSDIQMKAVTDVPNEATPGKTKGGYNPGGAGTFYLGDGEVKNGMFAFINELRDHDATISGNYIFTNKGGEGNGANRIFLSHNPAGLGAGEGITNYDGHNGAKVRTATFDGNLTLHGTAKPYTGMGAHSDVTIGVEHQLWTNSADVYSIFRNTGKIKLVSGNNLVGILIDIERNYPKEKSTPHKTVNDGLIEIENAENSIGIDYGEYSDYIFKSELTVGDIIVGGKKNYGLRMANIFTGNAAYFDKGTTIKSGGADKKILVKGEENVGVSIAKFLSKDKDSNPIAGITEGLNIEVNGNKTVGFLRNKDYSNNNTNDMILNENTMGTFSFGDDAENSTLIRSDKYGITLKKDITIEKGKEGNSFAQALGEGKIINEVTLTSLGRTKFTGLVSKGKVGSNNSTITNKGTISITGDGSKNVGMAALKDGNLVNSGTVTVTGTGTKNVGIFHNFPYW